MPRTQFPWSIQPKTPEGPLIDEQMRRSLSEQFEIPLELLKQLSADLGRALDRWLFVPSIVTAVNARQNLPRIASILAERLADEGASLLEGLRSLPPASGRLSTDL